MPSKAPNAEGNRRMPVVSKEVGGAASQVAVWSHHSGAKIIQNTGDVPVYLGTANTVTADGSTAALVVAAGESLSLPEGGGELWAVCASGNSSALTAFSW
jgi:hypothetical protein